eukprot:9480981-Pyramimonas_sp.AAC.1
MSCLPSRTTPIIAMDLNDGLGRRHGPHGLSNIVSSALGEHGRGEEHLAGGLMRGFAETYSLAAANTFFHCGPSYYGA